MVHEYVNNHEMKCKVIKDEITDRSGLF